MIPQDKINVDLTEKLKDGMNIKISGQEDHN